ncbi:acyl carrier protein [bacterium]|nr:acyl carrier protein [bacterium]
MADADDIKQRIKKTIVEALRLKQAPESIEDDGALFVGGLNLDSIDILTLISELEERFEIRIEDDEIRQVNSVNDIAAMIQGKKNLSNN